MSKFQIIVLSIFVVCIIAGVIAFATFKGGSSTVTLSPVTVWGTFPADVFNKYVADVNNGLAQTMTVTYTQLKPEQFSNTFISALARGTGPDVVLLPVDMILPHIDKITPIPYAALPQRTFMDTYIQEANIYLTTTGALAMPFTVDPLIMYWNRDTFDAAGIATYPNTWDEFNGLIQKLTVKDSNGNVRKTALSMGDFTNTNNAREVVGSLLMQLGNPVTAYDSNGTLKTTISTSGGSAPSSVLKFYTQFVDPSNPNYTWNRGMPNDKTAFLSGISATYFGFASELKDIRAKNPNLNFDAAPLPQVKTGGVKAGYGKMYGFSIIKSSPNSNNDYQIISTLTSPTYMPKLVDAMYLPSVRRDVIGQGSSDPYIDIFNRAALISGAWLDADATQSRQLFANMVQSITSGKSDITGAIQDTENQYDLLLQNAVTQ
jgi:ABC-type glycerol-3-phosphate transport system substrate-binding protein